LPEKLRRSLVGKGFTSADAEQAALRKVMAVRKSKAEPNKAISESILNIQGLNVSQRNGVLTLKGAKLTPSLQNDLLAWLRRQVET
jgi:hypothetical protein